MIGRRFLQAVWQAGMAMVNTLAMELAGHIAFTGLLAIFPFLIFLAALAGFIGTYGDGMASVDAAFDMLPPDVAETLRPVIDEVLRDFEGFAAAGSAEDSASLPESVATPTLL